MTLVAEPELRSASPVTFGFANGVRDALPRFRGRCTVVRLATLDNDVLGVPRWYTLQDAWAEEGSALASRWAGNPVVQVGPSDDPELVLATATPVVVVGADNAATRWARQVVDAVRATCRSVLVVDMGAHPEPSYADIATFGHDRRHGAALLALLTAS
ncbi:hypothetical protein [Leifsonia shinshuensis]|uniref:hypothetical protein n=1 Tax=Leifsonia TaxID=110932 RepID=UPI0028652CB2|nr:hypothetical protein [Leifsonia shinshuensis]MDR6970055.1 hypothetical protein [Leifsonia shinshuensis]